MTSCTGSSSSKGPVHEVLDCVALTVRRKLDLAGWKFSHAGWQAVRRAERLSLCHVPVDGPGEADVYRQVLEGFAARAGVTMKPLKDPLVDSREWNSPTIPALLASALADRGLPLPRDDWARLDEEARYALLKLADPKREPQKLRWAMIELGLVAS